MYISLQERGLDPLISCLQSCFIFWAVCWYQLFTLVTCEQSDRPVDKKISFTPECVCMYIWLSCTLHPWHHHHQHPAPGGGTSTGEPLIFKGFISPGCLEATCTLNICRALWEEKKLCISRPQDKASSSKISTCLASNSSVVWWDIKKENWDCRWLIFMIARYSNCWDENYNYVFTAIICYSSSCFIKLLQ